MCARNAEDSSCVWTHQSRERSSCLLWLLFFLASMWCVRGGQACGCRSSPHSQVRAGVGHTAGMCLSGGTIQLAEVITPHRGQMLKGKSLTRNLKRLILTRCLWQQLKKVLQWPQQMTAIHVSSLSKAKKKKMKAVSYCSICTVLLLFICVYWVQIQLMHCWGWREIWLTHPVLTFHR